MKVLVTGSKGQLGNHMRLVVAKAANEGRICNDYLFADIDELDITNLQAVRDFVMSNEIGCIVNCVAYTAVDQAEDEEQKAELINATAIGYLAQVMKEVDGWLIHTSTDYVFNGSQCTPYREDDSVCPESAYGRTKLHGERLVQKSGCHYLIVRTAWLYSLFGKNFVKTMMNIQSTRDVCKVVIDQVGSPTYADDLAQALFHIVESGDLEGREGIYHFSNEGVCSWYDFAVMIGQLMGSSCKVMPCRSSEYPSKVVRPTYSVLDKSKLKNTFNIPVRHWLSALQDCMNGFNTNLN